MMQKIEHIGIAVADIDEGEALYTQILGVAPYKREAVEREGVITSFFRCGGSKIELVAATSDEGAIAKFVQKRGPGIHHIAYAVTDIKAEMTRMKDEGFTLLHDEPVRGADNKWICFVHPKTTGGTLIELCQEIH